MKTLYIQYPSIVNLSIKSLRTDGGAVIQANEDGTFGPLLGNYQIEDNCTVSFVKTTKPDVKLDASRAQLAMRRQMIARDLRLPAYVAGTRWQGNTVYTKPDVAVLPSGDIAIVTGNGTSGTTPPTPSYTASPSAGITDGTAKWYLLGESSQQGAVPVRANSTFYRANTLAVLSGGQLVRASTSGTTGPSAPTYSATAAIVDGSVTWYATAAADLDADEVLVTDNAGNPGDTTIYNPWLQPSLFTQPTTTTVDVVADTGSTSRHRAWLFNDGTVLDNGLGPNGRMPGTRNLLFKTESNILDIAYFATDGSNELIQVFDGNKRLFEIPFKLVQGSSRYLRVLIPGGRRLRNIRVTVAGQVGLRGIGVAPSCTLRPVDTVDPVLMLNSDSYNNTEMPDIKNVHYDLAQQLGNRLGFPHVVNVSSGGTAYSIDASTGRKSLAWVYANNAALANLKVDCVVNATGFNAAGAGTDASQEDVKALEVWSKQLQMYPGAPMAVVLPWFERTGQEVATRNVATRLRNAFFSLGYANSFLVNPLDGSVVRADGEVVVSSGQAWINSTNVSWIVPPAGGDFDGVHLSVPGVRYVTDCLAQAVDAGLASLGYGLAGNPV